MKLKALYGIMMIMAIVGGLLLLREEEKREISDKFETEHSVVNIKLQHDEDIVFRGYVDYPCSISLVTNSDEVSFSSLPTYVTSQNAVAYSKNNILHIANYIMDYTTNDLMKEYILKCDEELVLKKKKAIAIIEKNRQSWDEK